VSIIFSVPCIYEHVWNLNALEITRRRVRTVPITVDTRSNFWIVDSNPTRGMDICVRLFCVCVVLCIGTSLATGWSMSKESYRLCIGLRNWKSGWDPTKSCRAIDEWMYGQTLLKYGSLKSTVNWNFYAGVLRCRLIPEKAIPYQKLKMLVHSLLWQSGTA
jgi:hypothetical protein